MGHFRNAQGEEAGVITHSGDSEAPGARDRFPNSLKCPECGQTGKIVWEENALGHQDSGPQRRLIDVTPGFHAEPGRTASGDPLIICTKCDTIQTD
jgi:hypothetical protein